MEKNNKWNLVHFEVLTTVVKREWFGVFQPCLRGNITEPGKYETKQPVGKPASSRFISGVRKTRPLRILPSLLFSYCAAFIFIIPSVAFAYTFPGNNYPSPNPNVVYDYDPGELDYYPVYGNGPYNTATEACAENVSGSPYHVGNTIITYSDSRAGVKSGYGYGCYYHEVDTNATTGQVTYDNPELFHQHWYSYQFVCPSGYQSLDYEKGPAGLGYEMGTAICGKPRQLFVALDFDNKPSNLGQSCPKTGDPVNPATGNKFEIETDYKESDSSPLHWTRTYNSMARDNGFWTHSYSSKLKPSFPYTLPPPNVIQSSKYTTLTIACSTGWNEIRPYAATQQLQQAYAVYEDGECGLYDSSNNKIGSTPIYTDLSPRWIKLYADKLDMVRSNGKVYEFTKVSGVWTSDADVQGQLEETLDANGYPASWKYTTGGGDVEIYDAAGKLLSITNPDGRQQTLSYSDSSTPGNIAPETGLLINVADSLSGQLDITYDANSRVQTVTDPENGVYSYTYDADGNISSVTFPDAESRTYLYNESSHTSGADLPHALTGVLDENGDRYSTTQYDTQGRAISTELAGGAEHTSLVYNSDGTTTVADALGTARTYTFQTINGVVKNTGVSQPCAICGGNAAQSISYDANGNVASKTDFNGIVTNYNYDLTRNLETSRVGAFGTPQERTISTQWHPDWRLPTSQAEPLKLTTWVYNGQPDPTNGNVVLICAPPPALINGLPIPVLCKKIEQATSDSNGSLGFSAATIGSPRIWNYTYDDHGKVLTVDGPRTDVTDVTTYTYNAQGNVSSVTNALGHVTNITAYDNNNRPLSIVDPNGLITTLTWSSRGWLTSRAVSNGTTTETTIYDYDGVGQLTKVTLPDGSYISYTNDAAHRLTGLADSLGNHISYTLDAMGNYTREDIYDPRNVLTQTRSHVYNALNRLAQDIGAQNQTTDYSYDNNDNLTSVSDPLGHATTNGYDALNRLVQVTDPANGITYYGYDAQDHLTSVSDPRNLQTTYSYDGLDDLKQLVSPDTGTTTNTYDAAGNLLTATDARGAVTTYTYDALNRVTQISAVLGGSTVTTTYQYDTGPHAIGKLSSISEANSTTTYAYDSFSRLSAKTQFIGAVSLTVAYAYDSAGRLSQITYPSGKVVSYGYDTQGRIDALDVDAQTVLNAVDYSPLGAATGWTWGNGSSYNRPLDSDGRVASFTLNGLLHAVTYDADSRIAALDDGNLQTFTYDSLDRLTNYSAPTVGQSFSYDGVGNRTQFSDGTYNDTYTYYSASNRLLSIAGSHAKSYNYAANGNITGDGSHSYTYDPRNRLVSVDASTTYTLNGLGQRIKKDSGGNVTIYAYDVQGQLIGEYDQAGAVIEETVYLGSQPVAVFKQNNIYYIHTDQLNTPRVITDSTNTVVWRWDSDPFGTTAANDDPDLDGVKFTYNLRFPGQYYDQETGLNYNYFRDYDPGTGRYVESDPIGLGGGLNTYAYVGNNPLSYIDPTGLSTAVVDRGNGTITVTMNNGQTVTYPAGNNTTNPSGDPNTVGSNGPAPAGTWPVQSPVNTSGDVRYGPYFWPIGAVDAQGNRADIARQRGIGLHGGRRSHQSRTQGCVRMDDADILDLYQRTTNDPLTTIEIR